MPGAQASRASSSLPAWLPPRRPGRLPRRHATPPPRRSLTLSGSLPFLCSPHRESPPTSLATTAATATSSLPLCVPELSPDPSPSTSTHRSPDAPRRCRGASSPTTAAGCRRPIHPLRPLPEHADLLFELTVSSYASPLSSPPRLRPVPSIPPEPELACRRPCLCRG